MMRADGAWKPAEAVRDPQGPIWPSATSIRGVLPELGRFQSGFDGAGLRGRGRVLDGVRLRKRDMMRADDAWKPAEAVRDPRAPIWPSATSIQ